MKMWSNDQPYTVGLPPSQGLPYQTLVVLTTHYGRTPRFNDDDGRDRRGSWTRWWWFWVVNPLVRG